MTMALAARVAKLQMKIDGMQSYADDIAAHTQECALLRMEGDEGAEGVTILTPKTGKPRKLIVQDLAFQLRTGTSLCIMGPSGCGKSSLLRVLGGLWAARSGKISRPEMQAYIEQHFGDRLDSKVVDRMMRAADKDGDGEMSFDEFEAMISTLVPIGDKRSKQLQALLLEPTLGDLE